MRANGRMGQLFWCYFTFDEYLHRSFTNFYFESDLGVTFFFFFLKVTHFESSKCRHFFTVRIFARKWSAQAGEDSDRICFLKLN